MSVQLLQAAISDPLGFVASGDDPRLIDEVQRAGDPLVRAIKAEVDAIRRPGRYVLAGSTRFLSTPSLSEPSAITKLLSYLASITAQEHNSAQTSNKTGLHRTTVNRYVELLEAVFLIHRLPAWSRTTTARVVKHSKVHVTDTGLAAALLGVSPESLTMPVAPTRGALVETFIVNELAKQATWSEARDTVTADDFRGLAALRDLVGDRFCQGIVLHTGKRGSVNFGERLLSLPIAALWEV